MVGYTGKDVLVEIYRDASTPGDAPVDWDTATKTAFAIATTASVNTSKEVTEFHGLNHQTPQEIKEGRITYEWSLEEIYTDTDFVDSGGANGVDFLELIDSGNRFAMRLTFTNEVTGTVERTIVLTHCVASSDNLEASDGGNVTGSMSGRAKTRTVS